MIPFDQWPDFSRRSERSELMEEAAISPGKLVETFKAIDRLGRVTGGRRASLRGLAAFDTDETDSMTILDVGAGTGALARSFVEWGERRDVEVRVLGIDLLPAAVRHARRDHADRAELEFACEDLFDLSGEGRFDLVHGSLVLHHFDGAETLEALDKMVELSRTGVVINDLHRHPLHWIGSRMLVPMVTRNRLAIHDGPLSVLRGFRRRELVELVERSNLGSGTLEWNFPFRWLLVGRR